MKTPQPAGRAFIHRSNDPAMQRNLTATLQPDIADASVVRDLPAARIARPRESIPMRLPAIAGLALSGVLLATAPEGAAAQGTAAECVQEPNGDSSMHRHCWDGGKRQGRWVLRFADGTVEEGPYVAGEKQGRWVLRFADGTVEEGPYVAGEKQGRWVLRLADGTVEEGPFAAGEKQGRWVLRLADGGVQEGPYVAGEKQGDWVLRFADGTVEEGPYVAGEKQGRWALRQPDGSARTFEMAGGRLVEGSVRVVARAQASEAAPPAAQQAQQNDSPPAWRVELRPHGDRAAQQTPPLWSLFGITHQPSNEARIMEALREGADPNAGDGNGNTSVHYAAAYHVGVLRAVIAHGGRCTARNAHGTTPLHVAAAQGAFGTGPEGVRILLDCGASPGAKDDLGNMPLHTLYEGVRKGGLSMLPNVGAHPLPGGSREDVLKALLEGGADPNARNNAEDTPMMVLLKGGGMPFTIQSHLRLFLKHDADANTVDGEGVTALIRTILEYGDHSSGLGDDLAGMLLKAGAKPDTPDRRGDTPLIHVLKLEYDNHKLAGMLLKAGADPDKPDRRGDTPLIHVAKSEYDSYVDALLAAGADPCLTDRNGKLPSDHATNEYTRIALINAGGFLVPDLEGGEEQCRRDMLAGAGEEKALALGRDERRRIQACLKAQGHDPGPADGVFGPRTRAAIRGWQAAKGEDAPATGHLTRAHADTLLSACQVAGSGKQAGAPGAVCPGKESDEEGDEGCWREVDSRPGCWMWNPEPQYETTVTWSGGCAGGKASGKGKAAWRWRKEGTGSGRRSLSRRHIAMAKGRMAIGSPPITMATLRKVR